MSEYASARCIPSETNNELAQPRRMNVGALRPRKIILVTLDWPQTALLVEALYRAGFEVTLITPALPDKLGLGRYCRQLASPEFGAADYVTFVQCAIERSNADLIVPLSEPIIGLLWTLHEYAGRLYPATTSWQRTLLADRRAFYREAQRHGLTVPRAKDLRDHRDVETAWRVFGSPLVIRGSHGFGGNQVRIVKDLDSAQRAYSEIRELSGSDPFAQEYIGGTRSLFGALAAGGDCLRFFAQDMLEAYPKPSSPSIRIRSIDDPTLIAASKTLFRALRLEGLACAEFMRRPSGEYVLLEVNPRPWAAIQAAEDCGVDLLRAFAEHLSGKSVQSAAEYQPNKECVLFPQFLLARIAARRRPTWEEVKLHVRSIGSAPWNRPRLMLHFVRRIWRESRAMALYARRVSAESTPEQYP